MKFSIVTFGCRVNQADSLQIEANLRRRGGHVVAADAADLVIVNTCSVTASADQGARQTIRRIARLNPDARIVATGCYATRCADDVARLPGVVRIIKNDDKLQLCDLLEIPTSERYADGDGPCGLPVEPGMAGRTAFALRVQTGCDQICSYCIIPTTRGHSRSLAVESVVCEARRVAEAGFKEITLTGVHLGSYGRDLPASASLFDLLCGLQRAELDVTFRISSLEPMDCTPEIVDLVSRSGGYFAPHFHLPLQHASDRMLTAMRRPYTLDDYRALVEGIVARLPHASIGTDMIVGFPGETEEDFAANLDYLSSSPLSHLHVFPYSDRPGTTASGMHGKVEGATIRERGARLRQLGAQLSVRFCQRHVGQVRPGLTLDDGTTVLTDNYLKVKIPVGLARNERVLVRIVGDRAGLVITPPSSSPAGDQARQSSTIP